MTRLQPAWPPAGGPEPAGEHPDEVLRVLLVEDDLGDALLVEEALADAGGGFTTSLARSLEEARRAATRGVDCILVDLGLPDAHGLGAVEAIVAEAPEAAVVVLTGASASDLAMAAVAHGAQDYLSKGDLGGNLVRAIRYAVQRKRAEETSRRLLANELVAAESARLERGLLPTVLVQDAELAWASRYRPSGGSITLGGDFYDAVELPDGTLRAMIGDVRGHGPDEAALGVAMRIAWRSLVLAGDPDTALLPHLQRVLVSERSDHELFATVCDLTVSADRARLECRSAGHPPPLLAWPARALTPPEVHGPPLGVIDDAEWVTAGWALPDRWTVLLYTDGLFEGRLGPGRQRGSVATLLDAVTSLQPADPEGPATAVELGLLADRVITGAEAAHGGPLDDDVAVLLVSGRRR